MKFYHKIDLPQCTLNDIVANADDVCEAVVDRCHPLEYFAGYLRDGYYPFRKENPKQYGMRVENVVDMIIGLELPQQRGVDVGNVRKLKSLLAVIATEVPMLIDITKLSKMTELSRVSLTSYLQYLHDARLVRLLYSDAMNVKRMQKPDKILLENPNLCYILNMGNANEGTVRETFFCNQVAYRHSVEYTKPADYVLDKKITIEVGGSSKDGGQIAGMPNAFLACDGIEYPYGKKIPLWLFGLLY